MSRKINRLAEFLPYILATTSAAVSRRTADIYEDRFGIRIPEWRIMAVLGDLGPRAQRDLVASTMLDKVAITRACKVLEQRGLITRHPHDSDGRSHHLELTDAGMAMHHEIVKIAFAVEERLFSVLGEKECAQLRDMLLRLREKAGMPVELN